MDCAAVKPRMEALVRGALPEAERALAEQHISICEGCRLELELVRAIGNQENPSAGGHEDWSIDRIFGKEGQQAAPPTASASSDALFSPPEPKSPEPPPTILESIADTSTSAIPAAEEPREATSEVGEGTKKAAESWDFEPVDAKAAGKPPEESLFFATEALTRRREAAKKPSNFRVVFWGVGGLIGAGLLAFSSWFVLHMQAPDRSGSDVQAPPQSTGQDGAPTLEPPEEDRDPDAIERQQNETQPPDEGSEAPDNTVQRAPTEQAPPSVTQSTTGPSPVVSPSGSASNANPPAVKLAPAQGSASTARAPLTATKPGARTTQPQTKAAPTTQVPEPETYFKQVPPRPQVKPYIPPPDEPEEGERWSEPSTEASTPKTKPRQNWLDARAGGSTTRPGTAKSAPSSGGTTSDAPPTEQSPAPESLAPIDRMHLATVAAEQKEDLAELRRLRSSWKSFISKMGVGATRARAKREYADCIWAIQALTGRRGDQKDALAAYRDYLLGAPAGGADSRSVSRLRELEDALSERR